MNIPDVYFSFFSVECLQRFNVTEFFCDLLRIGTRALFAFNVIVHRCDGQILTVVYHVHLCFFRFRGVKDFGLKLF